MGTAVSCVRSAEIRLLVADIGGTNSRFAFMEGQPLRMTACCAVSSAAANFTEVLERVAAKTPLIFHRPADCCILAIAGPVHSQKVVQCTNLPYAIERAALSRLATRLYFVNDFVAQAWACTTEAMGRAQQILPGDTVTTSWHISRLRQGIGVIGAGTGMGMAFCHQGNDGKIRVMPSEGGHMLYAFHGGAEHEYAAYLRTLQGREEVSYEDVLSGRGLMSLHAFLTGKKLEPDSITAAEDFPSSETCAWFARFYGRACRHMALLFLSQGGIVITGGVAGSCSALVCHEAFGNEFVQAPPTQRTVLETVPVWLNTDPAAGLWGAAQLGMQAIL